MPETIYTHALWRVKPEHEDAFIAAWNELAEVFSALPARPLWGALIRSTADPAVFYSFGPWRRLEDALAMRADRVAAQAIARVKEHCSEATPEICELVRHVAPLKSQSRPGNT